MNQPLGYREPHTGEKAEFAMFSKRGNARVGQLVDQVKALAANQQISRESAVAFLKSDVDRLRKFKSYAEIPDTDVRECIAYALDAAFEARGWKRVSIFEF